MTKRQLKAKVLNTLNKSYDYGFTPYEAEVITNLMLDFVEQPTDHKMNQINGVIWSRVNNLGSGEAGQIAKRNIEQSYIIIDLMNRVFDLINDQKREEQK